MQAFGCRISVPITTVMLSCAAIQGPSTLCRAWQNQHHDEQCCLQGALFIAGLAFFMLHIYLTRVSTKCRVWQNLHHDRHAERW